MPKNISPVTLIIGVLVVIGLGFFALRGCAPGSIPNTGPNTGSVGSSAQQGNLGQPFVADELTGSGCPANSTAQLGSDRPIYVGFMQSDIPIGTRIFARLIREGRALEDTKEITANSNMVNRCVWFQFSPSRASNGFQPGNYAADLFVNGNRAGTVNFNVAAGDGSLFSPGSSNNNSNLQLGRLTTTTRVDQNGCPTDNVVEFRPDESVYLAYDQSIVPAGTQMFARLLYEGQPVEDTQPISAPRDMQSCIWFVFEPSQTSQGLQTGTYQAQIFVNGNAVDQIQFEVR